jgi:putative oxidoreductase
MLGTIFMVSGARAVAEPHRLVHRAKPVTDRVAPLLERTDKRLPSDPATLVRLNGAVQAVAGALMLTRRYSRPAALVLAGTMVPTTVAGHPFWAVEDRQEARAQQTQFLKNLAIMGGLILAGVDTQGRPGLTWRTKRLARDTRHRVSDAQWRAQHLVGDAGREVRNKADKARVAARAMNVGRHLPG